MAEVPITSRDEAEFQQLDDRLLVADAAAEFALDVDGVEDRLDAGQIDGQAFAGAVEIDDVQMLGAGVGELPGHGGRVVGEDGFLLRSRPAAGGRTCRREGRSPAKFAWTAVP